ncbi:hypothetical protein X740_16475 [Mesorhizobium sp. LNHC221B00]|nr:hypothetical protein X740_16475 [Mesorhizobium sp. LNHC221B00]
MLMDVGEPPERGPANADCFGLRMLFAVRRNRYLFTLIERDSVGAAIGLDHF